MDLIEKIPERELRAIGQYIDEYALDGEERTADVPYILREWNTQKQDLYNMLGGLTLSKQVEFNKEEADMQEDILNTVMHGKGRKFYNQFCVKQNSLFTYPWSDADREMYNCLNTLMSYSTLTTNIYEGHTFSIIDENTDKEVVIQNGCKALKALGKIAEAWNLEGFEEFRLAHSVALNDKTIKGKLTLSIHPLDYMTMSDNASRWSSCMNWRDNGEYRRGTVEMMNSKYVVVAYLESEETFQPLYNFEWNNKKWRELFIVEDNILAGVKGYPFWNRGIEQIVLDWLNELSGYKYFDEDCHSDYHKNDIVKSDNVGPVKVAFTTSTMYNDCYSEHHIRFAKTFANVASEYISHCYYVHYSGESECMACGSTCADFDCEGDLVCYECAGGRDYCSWCGEHIYGDVYWADGQCYCEDCYNELPNCADCGDVHSSDNMNKVYVALDENTIAKSKYIYLCNSCIDNDAIHIRRWKDSTYGWSMSVYYVLIDDMTDDWLEYAGCYDAEELRDGFEAGRYNLHDLNLSNKEVNLPF